MFHFAQTFRHQFFIAFYASGVSLRIADNKTNKVTRQITYQEETVQGNKKINMKWKPLIQAIHMDA